MVIKGGGTTRAAPFRCSTLARPRSFAPGALHIFAYFARHGGRG